MSAGDLFRSYTLRSLIVFYMSVTTMGVKGWSFPSETWPDARDYEIKSSQRKIIHACLIIKRPKDG